MQYQFSPYVVDVESVNTPIEGYDAFDVVVWQMGADRATTAQLFQVLRPEGPTGPYRPMKVAQDVIRDLWDASYNPEFVHFLRSKAYPPEGPVRDAYLEYVDQLKVGAAPLFENELHMAVQESQKIDTTRTVAEMQNTPDSLHNAKVLLNKWGLPDEVFLKFDLGDFPPAGYEVVALWYAQERRTRTAHVFNGFSWGYRGTGPQGLLEFFRMLGIKPRWTIGDVLKIPGEEAQKELYRQTPWRKGRKAWDPDAPPPIPTQLPGFRKGVDYGVEE